MFLHSNESQRSSECKRISEYSIAETSDGNPQERDGTVKEPSPIILFTNRLSRMYDVVEPLQKFRYDDLRYVENRLHDSRVKYRVNLKCTSYVMLKRTR